MFGLQASLTIVPNLIHAILSGAAGAIALNLMHECARQSVSNAPRMDILGMRAMSGLSRAAGFAPPQNLRAATLGADLVANAVYYSTVALGGPVHAVAIGAALGTAGGIGGVLLPGPLGLGSAEVNRTRSSELMTVGMYATAGLLAGLVYRHLEGPRH
jgi:hypothetical protein